MEYYPPPLPGKKDHTVLKIVLAGIGCFTLVVGLGIFLATRFFSSLSGPTDAVESQLEAINQGNYELAYAHFSAKFRQEKSMKDFREEMEGFSSLLPTRQSSFNDVRIRNDEASIEGVLTGRDGAIFPVAYVLIKEGKDWKISAYQWVSPGERIQV